jgi:hypothetical protein
MEQVNSILDKCVVMEETDCLQSAAHLQQMVEQAIEALGQATTLEQITLAAPGGDFRVRISLSHFQLVATPLRRNEKGEWVAQPGAEGLVSSRWQMQADGSFVRFA